MNAWSAATRAERRPSTVVVGGREFRGMSTRVVIPSAAAARVADASPPTRCGRVVDVHVRVHQPREKGSSSARSITSCRKILCRAVRPHHHTAAQLISWAAMPAFVKMRLPRMTRSKPFADIQGILCGTLPLARRRGRRPEPVGQFRADCLPYCSSRGAASAMHISILPSSEVNG